MKESCVLFSSHLPVLSGETRALRERGRASFSFEEQLCFVPRHHAWVICEVLSFLLLPGGERESEREGEREKESKCNLLFPVKRARLRPFLLPEL